MLATLGYETLDAFIDAVVPEDIRLRRPLALPPGRTEREVLQALRGLAAQNQLYRSYIGMGYYHSFTPQVIQRNIVENPGWYTAYTPYQPEIAQGRLRSEEHTSELQSRLHLVCRLLLEKKNNSNLT